MKYFFNEKEDNLFSLFLFIFTQAEVSGRLEVAFIKV